MKPPRTAGVGQTNVQSIQTSIFESTLSVNGRNRLQTTRTALRARDKSYSLGAFGDQPVSH